MKKSLSLLFLYSLSLINPAQAEDLTLLNPKAGVGKSLFFDTGLSNPPGVSCASCHRPEAGFNGTGNPAEVACPGARPGVRGFRNPLSFAYACFSPMRHADRGADTYVGGQCWDGRDAYLTERDGEAFLDPLGFGCPGKEAVVVKVCASPYGELFRQVYGDEACSEPSKGYDFLVDALAAFQRSPEVNPFSSKFDAFLAGRVPLSEAEARGHKIFAGKGRCSSCHVARAAGYSRYPLFTDFSYHNAGLPRNPGNPWYVMPAEVNPEGIEAVDRGLGGALGDPRQYGKFKVPTLRNVALSPPFGHNGYFKTLASAVRFFAWRDLESYPPPEVPETVSRRIGYMGLTDEEISDIVEFLGALSDGYTVPGG